MRVIRPVPLTSELFAPFGEVHESPSGLGRDYFDEALTSLRPEAHPSISFVRNSPVSSAQLHVDRLEQHKYSSQTFVPINASRWLVVVAGDREGQPDSETVKVFIASETQGLTFAPGTWHLGLHVLDRVSTHAIFMWRDGTDGDETFADVQLFSIDLS